MHKIYSRALALFLVVGTAHIPAQAQAQAPAEKAKSTAPVQNGLRFGWGVAAPSTYSKTYSSPTSQDIEAFARLEWADPPQKNPDGSWVSLKAKQLWDSVASAIGVVSGSVTELDPPLPYYEVNADFDVSAKRYQNTGQPSDFFSPQTYTWEPSENATTEATTNEPQRSYSWRFDIEAQGNSEAPPTGNQGFPKNTDVKVTVKGAGANEEIKAKANFQWFSSWSSTGTGLQNTTTLGPTDLVTLANGTTKFVADLQVGDQIVCFVRGEVGSWGQRGKTLGARPVMYGQQQQPQPDERRENRGILHIEHLSDGGVVLSFDAAPHLNPEDDPNAPGFQEIQQSKEIDIAIQNTNRTGQVLVATAFEVEKFAIEQVTTGRVQGWAIEGAIKGIVALGRLAEEANAARRAAQAWETTAVDIRAAAARFRALKQAGGLSPEIAINFEKRALDYDRQAVKMERAAADARGYASKNEAWIVKAQTEARTNGCFVSGTLVWMGDGTTKRIEQVKVGDLVLSKNEKSGEVAAKKVTNTSVRQGIKTLKLHFEDDSVLETTDEHPLYLQGSGFVPAKEARVGSSIVTRAGPALTINKVESDLRTATVYNFTVQDFHTYFVAHSALWVHNNPPCNIGEYSGHPTEISPRNDADTIRSLTRENEAAEKLLGEGYGIFQNPPELPNKKNPDYFLKGPGIASEGEYFDCLSPRTSNARNMVSQIAGKVNKDQAPNVVLNLADSNINLDDLSAAIAEDLAADPATGTSQLENLRSLLVIDKLGNLIKLYP